MKQLVKKSAEFLGIILLSAVVSVLFDLIVSCFIGIVCHASILNVMHSEGMSGITLVLFLLWVIALYVIRTTKK